MQDFPKIHSAAASDEMRPTMNHIWVFPEYTYASDAHILVRHRSHELFDEDFMKHVTDEGLPLSKEIIIECCKRNSTNVTIIESGKDLLAEVFYTGGKSTIFRVPNKNMLGNPPNFEAVIPELKNKEAVVAVGINGKILARLQEAMGAEHGLALTFMGIARAIHVGLARGTDNNKLQIGLIMPVMVEV